MKSINGYHDYLQDKFGYIYPRDGLVGGDNIIISGNDARGSIADFIDYNNEVVAGRYDARRGVDKHIDWGYFICKDL